MTRARTDESTFPLRELPYVLCICVSLLWLAADSFRCSTSSRSLIYALTVQEGNSISGTAATDRLPISHSCEEKETQCSSSQSIPKFNYSRILSWMEGVAFYVFFFFFFSLWLPSWWWMWQKYTAVTVHDSTPLRKILVGMPFKVKLVLHLECTPGHRALTRVLSDDVTLSKPPCRRQDGKQELQTEKCEKTEIGGDGWDVSGCAAWKHVVLLADFLVFF